MAAVAGSGMAWVGKARQGSSGTAWRGKAGRGSARYGSSGGHGWARHGPARRGKARPTGAVMNGWFRSSPPTAEELLRRRLWQPLFGGGTTSLVGQNSSYRGVDT